MRNLNKHPTRKKETGHRQTGKKNEVKTIQQVRKLETLS